MVLLRAGIVNSSRAGTPFARWHAISEFLISYEKLLKGLGVLVWTGQSLGRGRGQMSDT
jgi:hypothetical protein